MIEMKNVAGTKIAGAMGGLARIREMKHDNRGIFDRTYIQANLEIARELNRGKAVVAFQKKLLKLDENAPGLDKVFMRYDWHAEAGVELAKILFDKFGYPKYEIEFFNALKDKKDWVGNDLDRVMDKALLVPYEFLLVKAFGILGGAKQTAFFVELLQCENETIRAAAFDVVKHQITAPINGCCVDEVNPFGFLAEKPVQYKLISHLFHEAEENRCNGNVAFDMLNLLRRLTRVGILPENKEKQLDQLLVQVRQLHGYGD